MLPFYRVKKYRWHGQESNLIKGKWALAIKSWIAFLLPRTKQISCPLRFSLKLKRNKKTQLQRWKSIKSIIDTNRWKSILAIFLVIDFHLFPILIDQLISIILIDIDYIDYWFSSIGHAGSYYIQLWPPLWRRLRCWWKLICYEQ